MIKCSPIYELINNPLIRPKKKV